MTMGILKKETSLHKYQWFEMFATGRTHRFYGRYSKLRNRPQYNY